MYQELPPQDIRSDFMEFFAPLVSDIGTGCSSRVGPQNHMFRFQTTTLNGGTHFQTMNFGIQKEIILLFWSIITGRELEWSRWNSSGPMKLQRINGATTIVDLFSLLILIILAAATKRPRIIIHLIDFYLRPGMTSRSGIIVIRLQ
jgi:hypothetical protein